MKPVDRNEKRRDELDAASGEAGIEADAVRSGDEFAKEVLRAAEKSEAEIERESERAERHHVLQYARNGIVSSFGKSVWDAHLARCLGHESIRSSARAAEVNPGTFHRRLKREYKTAGRRHARKLAKKMRRAKTGILDPLNLDVALPEEGHAIPIRHSVVPEEEIEEGLEDRVFWLMTVIVTLLFIMNRVLYICWTLSTELIIELALVSDSPAVTRWLSREHQQDEVVDLRTGERVPIPENQL